ncbi:MAG: right-handed parallel beta-helix repeat-containing protein, partial [Candidatus Firestonebacteria bacterium]|nr:right-handed parallel beta-helix repeat-containing protein [Candidatus Firestonebacteria bacterium]
YGVRMKQSDEINEPCMVNITHSIFENNDTGISLRNAICNADSNILQKNKIAIWLKEGVIIKIVNNTIKDNTKGIFFTNTPKIRITKNNIFGNNYNIYLGENQKEDIDALNNWWGSAVPEEIEKKILDQKWDSSLGTVNYIPFLHNPN